MLWHFPPYLREDAVRKVLSRTDPTLKAPVLEGKLALARMAFEAKDTAKGDSIVAELAGLSIGKPILVFAPPYDLGLSQADNAENAGVEQSSGQSVSTGGPDGGSGARSPTWGVDRAPRLAEP